MTDDEGEAGPRGESPRRQPGNLVRGWERNPVCVQLRRGSGNKEASEAPELRRGLLAFAPTATGLLPVSPSF